MIIFNLNDWQYHVWNELQVFDYEVPNACDNSKTMVMTRFLNTILWGQFFFFCDWNSIAVMWQMVQNNVKCVQKKRGIKINYLRQHENNKPFEKSAQMTWKSSSLTRFTNFRRNLHGIDLHYKRRKLHAIWIFFPSHEANWNSFSSHEGNDIQNGPLCQSIDYKSCTHPYSIQLSNLTR